MYEELIERLQAADNSLGDDGYDLDGHARIPIAEAISELSKIAKMVMPITPRALPSQAALDLAGSALSGLWGGDYIKAQQAVAFHIEIASQLGQLAGKSDKVKPLTPPLPGNNQLPLTYDLGLSFNQLRKANSERCDKGFHHKVAEWNPAWWMVCLAGEVGELAHLLKNARRGATIDKSCLANELADCAIYVDLLADCIGVDLGKAVVRKFNLTSDNIKSNIKLAESPSPRPYDHDHWMFTIDNKSE